MGARKEINQVIRQIYDAGSGMASWEDVMVNVCDLLDSAEMIIYEFDPVTGETPYMAATTGFHSILADFSGHYVRADPRVRHAAANPGLTFLVDYDHITEAEMDRSEHYAWLQRDSGVRYYMGWREHLSDGLQWGAAVQRTLLQGHAQAEQAELFKIAAPHLLRAHELRRQLGELYQLKRGFAAALEELGRGVLIIDQTGTVSFANRAARQIAEAADGLGFDGSSISITLARDNTRFRKALAAVVVGGNGILPSGEILAVSRPSGKCPYTLQISPVSESNGELGENGPLALVVISDSDATKITAFENLQALFGLTQAEARLAAEMSTGDSLAQVAERLGITRETARSRLKQVFAKTDTHRQAELVHLLLSLP